MKKAEILSVGDELLLGDVVDTNAAYLSRALREVGYSVLFRQTCGDRRGEIAFALRLALSRADLVLVTGGLGPTYDDLTRPVAAEVFGMPLENDEETKKRLRGYFERRGIRMSENNLLQAQVPKGAVVLTNDWGTAPGLWLQNEKGNAILLPGVPREMKALFENRVKPVLEQKSEVSFFTLILHLYGISESLLDEKISFFSAKPEVVIAPYAMPGEVELHITSSGEDRAQAEKKCRDTAASLQEIVGEFCYGEGETSLEKELVEMARQKGITLATAESCTGGMVSQRITSVPGASQVLSLGVCSYWEETKQSVLGVKEETLCKFGVYSKECALEMARGARVRSGATLGIGITGIAGPSGGTKSDPVGTVYIAVSGEKGDECQRVVLGSIKPDRNHIRYLASSKALAMALETVRKM